MEAVRRCVAATTQDRGCEFDITPLGSEEAFPFKGLLIYKLA